MYDVDIIYVYSVLRVLEFNNKVTMNITGIKVGRNVITLPPEILGEEILEPGKSACVF